MHTIVRASTEAAYNEPQNLSFLVEPMLGGELSEADVLV